MGHYKSNLRDIEFNLFEVLGTGDVLGTGPFAELDADTVRGILAEVRTLAEGPLAESYVDADRNPPVFDPATNSVTMPESFKKSYKAWQDAEWWRLETHPRLRRHAGAPVAGLVDGRAGAGRQPGDLDVQLRPGLRQHHPRARHRRAAARSAS